MTDAMRDAVEFLPCPFCGGDKIVLSGPTCSKADKYHPADRAYPIASCRECYADAAGADWDVTAQSAVVAWNRRIQPRTAAAVAEAVKGEREACAQIASAFSMKPDRSVHPDIAWDDMTEGAKMVAHTVAQQIAIEIRSRPRVTP